MDTRNPGEAGSSSTTTRVNVEALGDGSATTKGQTSTEQVTRSQSVSEGSEQEPTSSQGQAESSTDVSPTETDAAGNQVDTVKDRNSAETSTFSDGTGEQPAILTNEAGEVVTVPEVRTGTDVNDDAETIVYWLSHRDSNQY